MSKNNNKFHEKRISLDCQTTTDTSKSKNTKYKNIQIRNEVYQIYRVSRILLFHPGLKQYFLQTTHFPA